jgi:hypothetical protein
VKKSIASGTLGFSMRQAFFAADSVRRLNYFAGQLLSADDLTSEQNYHRDKRRRHNLHCHGVGIVEGLKVSTLCKNSSWRVVIGPGVAIDPAGNEIELCATAQLPLPKTPAAIQVGIRFSERLSAPVPSLSDPMLQGSQPSRVEEGCEVLLDSVPMTRGLQGKRSGPDLEVLPLAQLVRVGGIWRVSRKFKVPRAR